MPFHELGLAAKRSKRSLNRFGCYTVAAVDANFRAFSSLSPYLPNSTPPLAMGWPKSIFARPLRQHTRGSSTSIELVFARGRRPREALRSDVVRPSWRIGERKNTEILDKRERERGGVSGTGGHAPAAADDVAACGEVVAGARCPWLALLLHSSARAEARPDLAVLVVCRFYRLSDFYVHVDLTKTIWHRLRSEKAWDVCRGFG
ncbi:hypothetical protein ACLOJK_025230 [Asimina triloba]